MLSRTVCCRMLAVVVLIPLLAGCSYNRLQAKHERTEAKLRDLERDNHRLENLLAVRRGEQNALETDYRRIQTEIRELRVELGTLEPASTVDTATPVPAVASADAATGFEDIDDVSVAHGNRGEIRLTLPQRILFPSGKDDLTQAGRRTLEAVADVLARDYLGRSVRVVGHTDSTPIRKMRKKYHSNWELSAARACTVLRALLDVKALDAERAAAVGRGPMQPVASNDTDTGRGANRRVEIVILPAQ